MSKITWRLACLLACAFFVACSNDDNTTPTVDPQAPTSGTWRVSLFSERGNDETGDFSGYTFTFNANNTAVAAKGGASKNGSWSIGNSSREFNIDFGEKSDANKPLGELTDDWEIISVSSNEIKLKDDNDDSAEFLTFTKN
ncbi:hypothetical protein F0L74_27440 [Chitinophaga agrisoli]|uniref:Lipocalin-like protein n=1 Tax=Chitinophaga agrisoli TaxID=2607653 RepID=A0A5B2VJZ3_9BACT|nr:hypothetical protein [Chitinophaga agrisoli]KAA2239923.1 hypothetical protein F0L74_27440 [Chitinophaga agrisoli]